MYVFSWGAGSSTPGVILFTPSREERTLSTWCTASSDPGCRLYFVCKGTFCLTHSAPGQAGGFLQSCIPAGQPPVSTGTWGYSSPGAGPLFFSLWNFIRFLLTHFSTMSRASSIIHYSWISVVCPTFCFIIQVINEDVEYWLLHQLLEYTVSDWLLGQSLQFPLLIMVLWPQQFCHIFSVYHGECYGSLFRKPC